MRTAALDVEQSRAELLRGPGNLTVGLGITLSHNQTI
jgi:3-methyladenine DNA glycosylase Mpg